MRQELSREEAATFAAAPKTIEVAYPLGSFEASFSNPDPQHESKKKTSKKRKEEEDEDGRSSMSGPSSKRKKTEDNEHIRGSNIFTPHDSKKLRKFSTDSLKNFKGLTDVDFKATLPKSMHSKHWLKLLKKISATAITKSSWAKYESAYNNLIMFGKDTKTKICWPLNEKTINGFSLWCIGEKNLAAATIKSYIYALSHIQKSKIFEGIPLAKSLAKKIILGGKNANLTSDHNKAHQKGAITFSKLKKLRKYLKNQANAHNENFTEIWACCTTAFFGSFRLGELVAEKSENFDKTTTLLWKDISKSKKCWKIHLKKPKSNFEFETVYLFPFPEKKLCPISHLKKLKKKQQKTGSYGEKNPVFRLNSGKNITKTFLNAILSDAFQKEKRKISCKSFRCGIPSSLGNLPEIANDQHIKGWGRWNSSSFLRYEHFGMNQKKWIFQKIVLSLLTKKREKINKKVKIKNYA